MGPVKVRSGHRSVASGPYWAAFPGRRMDLTMRAPHFRRCRAPAIAPTIALAFGLAAFPAGPAPAAEDARASAVYDVTFVGLTVGKAVLGLSMGEARYEASLSARVRGLARLFSSGSGRAEAAGRTQGGALLPERFTMTIRDDDGAETTAMRLAGGNVASVSRDPPDRRARARVPVTQAHRRGVRDPVTALVLPQTQEAPVPDDCNRTLAVFDGVQRYDIVLRYAGQRGVRAQDGTYAGPVLVCRARYVPVAGHRKGRRTIEDLARADIEVWLAPAGTGVLLPFRLAVPTGYGTLVATARKFFPAR